MVKVLIKKKIVIILAQLKVRIKDYFEGQPVGSVG